MASAEENQVNFARELLRLRAQAIASGISTAVVERAFDSLEPDLSVVELLDNQPEHSRAVWDYIANAASADRIEEGRGKLEEHAKLLDEIETRYRVDRAVVVSIWGLESAFGSAMGERNIIRSLVTLAIYGDRRARYGKQQLFASLKILENGDVELDGLTGSWAGAMGHTQFIPTTYRAHGVDFDGDGKRNIWTSVADALASTANYLKVSGWRPDYAWGVEVSVPPDFDFGLAGYARRRQVSEWTALGIKPVAGAKLPGADVKTSLILPAGAHGPGFLITRNFRAILRYNNSTAYALAVAHLADRLNGGGEIVQSWPVDEKPLGRSERAELQGLLDRAGFASGGVDGIIGTNTRKALRDYQRSKKLPADGYPSSKLLDLLRREGKS